MRKHSKFSASGAERWMKCPGSVELSEGIEEVSSPWAQEGTYAHEVLEQMLECRIEKGTVSTRDITVDVMDENMYKHGVHAANFIIGIYKGCESEINVETKVSLEFLHPEMFGTLDSSVAEFFGILNIFDYKYGAGIAVSPGENVQMIIYAIAVAHKYDWNFEKARLWIIQPRIKGYDGPVYWDVSMTELRYFWVPKLQDAIENVERNPKLFLEGGHCHWCKAKRICPLKTGKQIDKATEIFK